MRTVLAKKIWTLLLSVLVVAGIFSTAGFATEEISDQPSELSQQQGTEQLSTEEITVYRAYEVMLQQAGEELPADGRFRIAIETDLAEIRFLPEGSTCVKKDLVLYHWHNDQLTVIEDAELDTEGILTFTTECFGTFLLQLKITFIPAQIKSIAAEGETYHIAVLYGDNAQIPEGAELAVGEILSTSEEFDAYIANAAEALGMEAEDLFYARFFDLSIMKDGEIIQPAEGSTVRVEMSMEDTESSTLRIIHFGESTEIIIPESFGKTITFEASGFSVYAIVDAPEPAQVTVRSVADLTELSNNTDEEFYLSVTRNNTVYYTTNTLNGNKAFIVSNNVSSAAGWYFEPVDGQEDQFYVYTKINGENRYIHNISGGNNAELVSREENPTVFEISEAEEGTFRLKIVGVNRWFNYSGGGSGMRFWDKQVDIFTNNPENSKITLTYSSSFSLPEDPYGLNGKTYGIAYHDESASSAALMADDSGVYRTDMLMRPDILDNDGILLVAEDTDITEWTFVAVEEDKYYLTATVDGQTKYLTFSGSSVTLEDAPVEGSVIKVTPGTGTNAGKWHFTVNNRSLNLTSNGFNTATGSGASTWMNLVEKSTILDDDDFILYNAQKVSVSQKHTVEEVDEEGNPVLDDEGNPKTHEEYDLQDKAQVIIYTRVWNDETKRYDFYAVDHDGSLIRCYDTGDSIEWIGSSINTAVWEFREGTYSDGTPTNYYWLRNVQYNEECIRPQVSNNQTIYESNILGTSDFNASVNLNGRRYGKNYTTIIAWDDDHYSYSGLKVEDGHVVPCALSEAEDFYFAIISDPDIPVDDLTTVETIDSEQFGISLKMIDYNNRKTGSADSPRDSVQNPFFGGDNNNPGLLSTDLQGDYPVTTSVTGNSGHSLSELYAGATAVNHLFIQSIYNESGYFEYDSTSNFAHLNDDGTFTVYDQLGAIGDYSTTTGTHGQFMPYNDLTPGEFCDFTNQTSVTAEELSDLDARKGETLYNIGNRSEVDYHFGMEMSANFTQTADGLDAWGHDIIFEFSGDDDFWFYVDGELVLDLGGVHRAMTGSINFRTGEVKSSRGNSTLYEIFKTNYEGRGLSEDVVAEKLNDIFVQKTVDGKTVYVFKDYTNHEMRMFYMERGAGASNLHMRFNLAAVKPGTFILGKKLSGTENSSNDLIEFPYQIWYYSEADGETIPHLLGAEPGEAEKVFYQDTNSPVKYRETFSQYQGAEPYEHVFFLKPGEYAEVNMPEDVTKYFVVECGVNPAVYEQVSANDTVLDTDLTDDEDKNEKPGYIISNNTITNGSEEEIYRRDYKTSAALLNERSSVLYDNMVSEGAMRTLSITKKLYDADGETLLHYNPEGTEKEDKTIFDFRLYLGDESTASGSLPLADNYSYFVKNRDGYYCKWDAGDKKFVPLDGHYTSYEGQNGLGEYLKTISPAEKESIVFKTSMSGSISKIPADYIVEIRDLIVGSKWKVEERDNEIPKGYTLRLEDGYQRTDDGHQENTYTEPIDGIIGVDESPEVLVSNQKGWGLTIKKVWTDKDFMETHDDIYFAVYLKGDNNSLTLVEGSVRRLQSDESEIYYFFDRTQMGEHQFSDYVIREVELEGVSITEDEDHNEIINYTVLQMIEDRGTLENGGKPFGGEHRDDYVYSVHYTVGEQTTQNENVRTDTVTNSRPGMKIFKTEWDFITPLAETVFTLFDEEGNNASAASYTSDETGLVTIAYLNPGIYTLTEIETPKGFVALNAPITITVGIDESIAVNGEGNGEGESILYRFDEATETEMATITIRNRPVELLVEKIDASTESPIEGVHFALYRQVTNQSGEKVKDLLPITGYGDIITNADGILESINIDNLTWGNTYYLSETETVEGYGLLEADLCFTIGKDGKVKIENEEYDGWLDTTQDSDGTLTYSITIPNKKLKKISFKKVDDNGNPIEGVQFDLSKVNFGSESNQPDSLYSDLVSGTDGILTDGQVTVFELENGVYLLTEKSAPAGFYPLKESVVITANDDGVKYRQDEQGDNDILAVQDENGIFIVTVVNNHGVVLPATGGSGTKAYTAAGLVLAAGAGGFLAMRRKKRREF